MNNRVSKEINALWPSLSDAACEERFLAFEARAGASRHAFGRKHASPPSEVFESNFAEPKRKDVDTATAVNQLKVKVQQLQQQLNAQRFRALEKEVFRNSVRSPEAALQEAGIFSKLSELRACVRMIFACDPVVSIDTDRELPDEHYLRFHVRYCGDVESAVKLQDSWYAATSAILGPMADRVHLMLSVE
jgi:hypothetical protein